MTKILATIWHYVGPIWHWTLGQFVTGVGVLAAALGNSAERPVLIYTLTFTLLAIFGPRIIRKVIRR